MKRIYILPAAVLTLGLAAPTFANDTVSSESKSETTMKENDGGGYHKEQIESSSDTNEQGTTTTMKTKVKVDADAKGDTDKVVRTETSTDPKGLMNKTKTVATDSVKHKNGKVVEKHTKKVNGKTVEEDSETSAPSQ